MEQAKVKEIYDEINAMSVVLPQDPQLGLEFYRDLLTHCRAHQDRVGDFMIATNRDFARVKIQLRGCRKQIEIAGPAQAVTFRGDLQALEDEADNLKYLIESLRTKKSNLAGASSDIRLTVGIIEDQVKLGTVQKPGDKPTADYGKVQHRPPVGAGTIVDVESLVADAGGEAPDSKPLDSVESVVDDEPPVLGAGGGVGPLPVQKQAEAPVVEAKVAEAPAPAAKKRGRPVKVAAIVAATKSEPDSDAAAEPDVVAAPAGKKPVVEEDVETIGDIDAFLEG